VHRLSHLFCGVAMTIAVWPAAAAVDHWSEAQRAFREQRYAAAYGRFARLADAGHAPAAQMALVMATQGPALFGRDWFASPDQRRRWNALVIDHARGRIELPDRAGGE
jgi:hypothetical protein